MAMPLASPANHLHQLTQGQSNDLCELLPGLRQYIKLGHCLVVARIPTAISQITFWFPGTGDRNETEYVAIEGLESRVGVMHVVGKHTDLGRGNLGMFANKIEHLTRLACQFREIPAMAERAGQWRGAQDRVKCLFSKSV